MCAASGCRPTSVGGLPTRVSAGDAELGQQAVLEQAADQVGDGDPAQAGVAGEVGPGGRAVGEQALQHQRQVVPLGVLGQQFADGAERAMAHAANAHLTPPAVRPPTTRRSMMANRMITGTVATRPAANRWPQSTEYSPMYWLIATVSGC